MKKSLLETSSTNFPARLGDRAYNSDTLDKRLAEDDKQVHKSCGRIREVFREKLKDTLAEQQINKGEKPKE